MKINQAHKNLLLFLQEKEKNDIPFNIDELLQATNWKKSTFKTYHNKGQLADFINDISVDNFEAYNTQTLSEVEFSKLLSQSKHRRGLGHNCKSKLSKALLKKSRDNMLLALELYNRPSLENRMDGFVMCFCTAWEQLLKAILIERDGEKSIFKKSKRNGGIKETISLRDCLSLLFKENNSIRKNIEKITFFRDQAVHLLMPEIQGIVSRVFQSGILNYSSKFEEFTEQSFLNSNHSGMISLVGDFKHPPLSALKTQYGNVANEILTLAEELIDEVDNINDIEYAIPLNIKLVFATDGDQGNIITLAKAEDGMQGLRKALIVEKPVDRERSHPYLEGTAITQLNRFLIEKYDTLVLQQSLVARSKTGELTVNQHCFRAMLEKTGFKNSNNKYHHKNNTPELHYYSQSFIEFLAHKITGGQDFLKKAKSDYRNNKKNLSTNDYYSSSIRLLII